MDDFLVAGPADNPEEALSLMRATAIASFGEAVRRIAREHFRYCALHERAVPRVEDHVLADPARCVCPPPGYEVPERPPDDAPFVP